MADRQAGEMLLVRCDACASNVSAPIEGSYERYADEAGYSVRWSLLHCPGCDSPLLVFQDDEDASYSEVDVSDRWGAPSRLYPEAQRQLGSSVPVPIRKAFDEARACYTEAKAYTACAIMCRKVLEGICVSHNATGGSLAAKLKSLADRGDLDRRLYDWVTALRVVGNEAAHDVNVTVSRDDAVDMLDLAEAVAEYLFTFKEKFDSFQQRRPARASARTASPLSAPIVQATPPIGAPAEALPQG